MLRWTAAGLMDIEPKLNKIQGAHYLNILRFKMQEAIKKHEGQQTQVKELLTAAVN